MFFFTAIGKIFYVLYCIVYPHPLSFYHLCKRIISLPNTKNAQSWRAPTVGDRTKATILQSERLQLALDFRSCLTYRPQYWKSKAKSYKFKMVGILMVFYDLLNIALKTYIPFPITYRENIYITRDERER